METAGRKGCWGSSDAFSLVEMLVVIALIIILMVFVAPALNSIVGGTNLNRAGQLIGDQLSFAKQEAVTKNREMQVLFFHLTNGATAGWRGIRVFRIEQTTNGSTMIPATRLSVMPEGILINTNLSPLLEADPTLGGTTNLPGYGNVPFAGIRYRANGLPGSTVGDANNFVTLNSANVTNNPPKNYYTIQINPITGKVIVFRP